jgi:hypothetical protein
MDMRTATPAAELVLRGCCEEAAWGSSSVCVLKRLAQLHMC